MIDGCDGNDFIVTFEFNGEFSDRVVLTFDEDTAVLIWNVTLEELASNILV